MQNLAAKRPISNKCYNKKATAYNKKRQSFLSIENLFFIFSNYISQREAKRCHIPVIIHLYAIGNRDVEKNQYAQNVM